MSRLHKALWKWGRPIKGAYGFLYDFVRFYRHSAWKLDFSCPETRSYYIVKLYHGLEKSLSFKSRNPNSGWDTARRLVSLLESGSSNGCLGYHEVAALDALAHFAHLPCNKSTLRGDDLLMRVQAMGHRQSGELGSFDISKAEFEKGLLEDPEKFFLSRSSIREYQPSAVPQTLIDRAIKLAIKTPSVCNRQAWHVYQSTSKATVRRVLSHQSGNRGFGPAAHNLLIIAADHRAFVHAEERYQHWIDGGMFAMSIIYAFHSLGLASCALNWSQTPGADKRLRKELGLAPSHSVLMMISFGFPEQTNRACRSYRRPLDSVLSQIEFVK
jgi:nitroreductase